MKGLAIVLGKPKSEKPSPFGKPEEEPEEEAEESETGSSEKEFARLASEAIAAGDHDAAAEAIVGVVKACMRGYGPKE